jgi:hypothetical protein
MLRDKYITIFDLKKIKNFLQLYRILLSLIFGHVSGLDPDPDSLGILDSDPYPDPEKKDPQHCLKPYKFSCRYQYLLVVNRQTMNVSSS